jgi:Tfp pilus assembly protein PilF
MALGALADILHRKGDVDGAVRCFDEAIAVAPNNRAVLFSQGLLLLTRGIEGDPDKASHLLARAVAADPTAVPCLYMYGRLLHLVYGRLAEAEDLYRRALLYEPNRGDILSDYGALLEAKGEDEATVRGMYKRAVLLAPSNADALCNYGRVVEESRGQGGVGGDSTATPLALYRRALAARPQHVPTMCNMALTLTCGAEGEGRRKEGRELLERAIRLQPSHLAALCQYARILQEDGKTDEAWHLYDKVVSLHPGKIDALNGLGTIYEARAQNIWSAAEYGDEKGEKERNQLLDKAKDMYRRALQIAPLHADTLCNAGALLMCHQGPPSHEEAEHNFRQVAPSPSARPLSLSPSLPLCIPSPPSGLVLVTSASLVNSNL